MTRRLMVPLGLLIATLWAGAMISCSGGGDEDDAGESVFALAVRVDGSGPALAAWAGNPVERAFALPPGSYYVEAVDAQGAVLSLGVVEVVSGSGVGIPANLERAGATQDAVAAGRLRLLGEFMFTAELAKLTALEAASGGFETALFDGDTSFEPGDLDPLYERYAELDGMRDEVLSAVDEIEARVVALGTVEPSPLVSSAAGRVDSTMAETGVFDSIKDTLFGFFGYAGNAGKRATDDILVVAGEMTIDEQEDAFIDISPALRGGATNFAELQQRLNNGELRNEAAQIRATLWGNASFHTVAQSVCKCNNAALFTAHREGGELVTKGAELQVEVVKTVLGDVLPDISEGFELADKANEWAEYAGGIYKDPLGTLEGQARDAVKGQIIERVEEALGDCCPLLADSHEEIAEGIGERVVAVIPELAPKLRPAAETAGDAADGGSPTVTGAAVSGATSTAAPAASGTGTATGTATVEVTETATPAPTAASTSTPAATSTPTATLTAVPPTSTATATATATSTATSTATAVPPTSTPTATATAVPSTPTAEPTTAVPVPPTAGICPGGVTTYDGREWTLEQLVVYDAVHAACNYVRVDTGTGGVNAHIYFGANAGRCGESGGVVVGGGAADSTVRTVSVLYVLSYPIPDIYELVLTPMVNSAVAQGVGVACE